MFSLIKSAFRSIVRSPLRTILIVFILTASFVLSLTIITVTGAYQNQLSSISGQIGNTVTVRPAGFFGAMGGGNPLNENDVDKIASLDHVVSITKSVQTRYTGTDITSAIQPGTLGGGNQTTSNQGQQFLRRVGIQIIGTDTNASSITLTNGAEANIVDGRLFNTDDEKKDVAILGKDLADANNLKVGSTFTLNGTKLEVIGIFDSGQLFGNNTILLPLKTAQKIFNIQGITDVTVTVDNADNEDTVVNEIRTIFDANTADITTSKSMYERIAGTLQNALNTSRLAMIISLVVAALVIVFSIVLALRQKIKEIGIMKAIGASNGRIGFQFVFEAFFLSLISAILGSALTFPLANTISNLLVGGGTAFGATPQRGQAARFFMGNNFFRVRNIQVAVSTNVFLYAILIAIGLAIVASIIPMFYISRVKPAEVLRYE